MSSPRILTSSKLPCGPTHRFVARMAAHIHASLYERANGEEPPLRREEL